MAAGDIIAEIELGDDPVSGAVTIFLDDELFVATRQQNLHRIDPDDTVRWEADAGGSTGNVNAGGVLLEDGTYVTGTTESEVRGYNFEDGSLSFSVDTGEDCEDSAPALLSDGTMVIGSNGGMTRFDPSNGEIVETYIPSGACDSSPALFNQDDDMVNVFTNEGVQSLTDELEVEWSAGDGFGLISHPSIDADRNVYAAASQSSELYKIGRDGVVKWTSDLSESGDNNFTTSINDDTEQVFCFESPPDGSVAGEVFDFSGDKQWSISHSSGVSSNVHIQPIPMTDGGWILPWENGVAKYTESGSQEWFTSIADGPVLSAPAASTSGFVACGSPDGSLYRIEIDALPRYTLQQANQRPWDASKFRHNSGVFNPRTLVIRDDLAIQGAGGGDGDDAVLHSEEVARGENTVAEGDNVAIISNDIAQG